MTGTCTETCSAGFDHEAAGSELYFLRARDPVRTNWLYDLNIKVSGTVGGGDNLGGTNLNANSNYAGNTSNFTGPEASTHAFFVFVTFAPDWPTSGGGLFTDSEPSNLAGGSLDYGAIESSIVGNNLTLTLPGTPDTYLADLGSGPEVFPREVVGGFELAFGIAPEVDPAVSPCMRGGLIGDPLDPTAGLIIGYNVYRVLDPGGVPPLGTLADPANWVYFMRLDDDPASTLTTLHDPDGVMYSGDEVLVYRDTPSAPDATPRSMGTPPLLDQRYWYAIAPVVSGSISDFAAASLAGGAPMDYTLGPLAVDLNLDGTPEFVSPQAALGLPGLGLSNGSMPLFSSPVFVTGSAVAMEDCANMVDDDGDGDIDCADSDCFNTPECGEAVCDADGDDLVDMDCCDNGGDDDGDGDVDCADADCTALPPCLPVAEACANMMDDDGDGDIDCEDSDCFNTPECGEAICDLDGDGMLDTDCCGNTVDDDGDGDTDCADPDCMSIPPCIPIDEVCTSMMDDDGDGDIDCEDSDCFNTPECGEAICDLDGDGMLDTDCCGNTVDDDGDGDTDCADPDCMSIPPCLPVDEVCTSMMDDDGDGDIDCADSDCFNTLDCGEAVCDVDGDEVVDMDCCDNGVDDDGNGDVDCDDAACAALPPCAPMDEDCSNMVDDDSDGLIDCDDPDCLTDPTGDCDGDGVENDVDCEPADPLIWDPPSEVGTLTVVRAAVGGGVEVSWPAVADADHYDILSGFLPEFWDAHVGTESGACAPAGEDVQSPYLDTRATPGGRPPGRNWDGLWYVIRAQKTCTGGYGVDSDNVERSLPAVGGCN